MDSNKITSQGAVLFAVILVAPCALSTFTGQIASSGLATLFAFAMFPAILIVGMILWQGTAIIGLIGSLRGRSPDETLIEQLNVEGRLPGASWVFIPVGLIIGAISGVWIGLFTRDLSFFVVVFLYGFFGLLYGGLLYMLGEADLLPNNLEEESHP